MSYESDILSEENTIANLREEGRRLTVPRKTINWQHQNARRGNRNSVQALLITKKARKGVGDKIRASENKIISLRDALAKSLGVK